MHNRITLISPPSFVGMDFICHFHNPSNKLQWFSSLCPTLKILQATYLLQCASITPLVTASLIFLLCNVSTKLLPSWTVSTHHLLSSQCGNSVATFQLILVLTWTTNFESPNQTFYLSKSNAKDFNLSRLGHLVLQD